MRQLAGLALMAFTLFKLVLAHLCLARLELDTVTLIFKHVLFDTFLAELLSDLCNFLEAFDMLFHFLDVSVILHLLALAIEVEIFDAAIQEHVLVVVAMHEWTDLLDVKTDGSHSDTITKLYLSQVLFSDLTRVLFLDVGALRKLKFTRSKTKFELPSSLDSLLSFLIDLSLLLNNLGSLSDLFLCVLVTAVVCQD